MSDPAFNAIHSLLAGMRAVLTDRMWPIKIAIGGLCMLSLIGIVLPYGLMIEHIDNSRRGFRTPLPPWRQLGDKAILGMLVAIFDFAYFILPMIMVIVLMFCAIFPLLFDSSVSIIGAVIAAIGLGGVWLFSFLLSLSPISNVYFSQDGDIESHLGRKTLQRSINHLVRGIYFRARLVTIPLYIPALLCGIQLWLMIGSTESSSLALIFIAWLFCCLLFLAWLMTNLVYLDAVEIAEDRLLDARIEARRASLNQ